MIVDQVTEVDTRLPKKNNDMCISQIITKRGEGGRGREGGRERERERERDDVLVG
jgi:hypothetical protein